MNETVRLATLYGAEHGYYAARRWLGTRPRDPSPAEPDLLTGEGTFAAVSQADLDAYADAFRRARDAALDDVRRGVAPLRRCPLCGRALVADPAYPRPLRPGPADWCHDHGGVAGRWLRARERL